MENLIIWLNKHNVNTNNLKIVDLPNNERGVVSAKHIKNGEYVFLIPKHLIITNKTAQQIPEINDLNKVFSQKNQTEKNIIQIAVYMLFAEAYEDVMDKVDWTPYFDTLPETLDHIPIFWEKELNYLKGSFLFERVKERNKIIYEEFKILKNKIPDFEEFSFYEYQRMRSIVSSRNFKLTIDNDVVSAMVPFADMLNHSNTCQTKWSFNNKLQSYEMVAKSLIKPGDEIMDSYGIKTMDSYFMFYGFVLPDSEARVYIKTNDFSGYVINDINDISFQRLLNSYKRKLGLDSCKFKKMECEFKIMQYILKLLIHIKKKYPHTKNYYNKNKTKGSQNKKNAYTLLAAELNIIESLIEKVSIIIKYLSRKEVDFKYKDVESYIVEHFIRQ